MVVNNYLRGAKIIALDGHVKPGDINTASAKIRNCNVASGWDFKLIVRVIEAWQPLQLVTPPVGISYQDTAFKGTIGKASTKFGDYGVPYTQCVEKWYEWDGLKAPKGLNIDKVWSQWYLFVYVNGTPILYETASGEHPYDKECGRIEFVKDKINQNKPGLIQFGQNTPLSMFVSNPGPCEIRPKLKFQLFDILNTLTSFQDREFDWPDTIGPGKPPQSATFDLPIPKLSAPGLNFFQSQPITDRDGRFGIRAFLMQDDKVVDLITLGEDTDEGAGTTGLTPREWAEDKLNAAIEKAKQALLKFQDSSFLLSQFDFGILNEGDAPGDGYLFLNLWSDVGGKRIWILDGKLFQTPVAVPMGGKWDVGGIVDFVPPNARGKLISGSAVLATKQKDLSLIHI